MKKYDVKSLAKRGGDSTMLIVLMAVSYTHLGKRR